MKRLIVNADDLGSDEARNSGIFEAVEAGVVTSVSILPNSPALQDAVAGLRSQVGTGISCGIHFNLSEGEPLAPGLKLLTGPDGRFRGKESARRLLLGGPNSVLDSEVRREFGAQFAALQSAGIQIDHLDGHQHVHVFPAVAHLVAEMAKEHGIRWIRIPEERADLAAGPLPPQLAQEAFLFSDSARAARPIVNAAGVSATDNFRGLYFKGNLPATHWKEFLEMLPNGLTELMVHPGRSCDGPGSGPFSGFSTPDRQKELEALTDGRFQDALRREGVELTAFPEVPF